MLDLNEIVTSVFNTLRKTHKTLTREDRTRLINTLTTMFDEHLTTQMYWTKRHVDFDPGRYLDMLGKLVEGVAAQHQYLLIEDILKSFDNLLMPVIDLPTWRIIYVRSRGSNVQLELGEDYRVKDWMAKNAKKYRLPDEPATW